LPNPSPPLEQALPYSADSSHWFARVRDLGTPVWLDSAHPFSDRGRYDIVSAAPLRVLTAAAADGDPFATVRAALDDCFEQRQPAGAWPFSGGAIGLFGYELGRRLQRLPARATAPLFPDLLIGIYSWAVVVDHVERRTALLIRPETPAALRAELQRRLQGDCAGPETTFALASDWDDEFPVDAYTAAFEKLQRYIQAGDCYQVNLARRRSAAFAGDPWQAYQRLRGVAAAPFSAYLESEHGTVLCLSPERFLAAENGNLLTQPIKGTAPRGVDAAADRRQAEALLASDKNRAENLMIVDLLRNDLGRSCIPGSIHVSRLFELQSFATVHHLVSSVHGQLRPDRHPLDALRDCFPGGSITGAPKLRAMQIIDELEPKDRAVFCGALGYIGVDGRMDTNLTIRTLLASGQRLHAWAGGGIVADSTCEAELAETNNKIEPLLRALGEGSITAA
jgi:para-aminobenzoate synthetase component 1